MTVLQTLKTHMARTRAGLRNLVRDRRGVAAVEFALIAPVLLALYFVTMEVSQAIETNKKVSRVGSMVADLVGQNGVVDPSSLKAIMEIGQAIIYPYNRTMPAIEITGINISDDTNPKVTVAWSRKLVDNVDSAGLEKKTIVTVPERLKIPGTFLIKVTTSLDYRPLITWAADEKASMGLAASFDKIEMAETYFLRPRMSNSVDCSAC